MQSTLKVFTHFKVEATIRLAGRMMQKHLCFVRCVAAFFDIAANTSRNNIFPSIAPATRSRDNMVQRQIIPSITAVFTGVTIAVENIAARQGNFLIRNPNIMTQPNHSWQGKPRVNIFTVVFNLLCFAFD